MELVIMLSSNEPYHEKIHGIVDQIKKRIEKYQQNLVIVSEKFQEEWKVHITNLGKILLITGAQSSGKTTLVSKLLSVTPNLHTINRKEQVHQTHAQIDQLFFSDLLQAASYTLGYKVSGIQFYELEMDKIHLKPEQKSLEHLHIAFKKIINSEFFMSAFNAAIFIAYYNAMKENLFLGINVILDDSILVSEELYNQFKSCCGNYPYIRRVLLFAKIETNLQNCIIRNSKFAAKVINYSLEKSVIEILKEQEIASGGSSDSYRFPKSIIKFYKTNYNLGAYIKDGDIVLASNSRQEMLAIFRQIAKEQLKILGLLAYRKHSIKEDYVEVDAEINRLFQDNMRVYFTSKIEPDYIIDASTIYHLSGTQLLKHLNKVLEWLNPSLDFYPTDEQHVLLSNEQHIISVRDIKKESIEFLYSTIKNGVYYQLDIKHNIAIINAFMDNYQLNRIISLIIQDVLVGKIVYIPISMKKNGIVQIISKFDEGIIIKFIYHNPGVEVLEHDSMALTLIPIFLFNAKKCGFDINVFDSRHLTSPNSNINPLILDEFIPSLSKPNFYKEWDIWSKCFGKVVVINGVSSAGKTTLSKHFRKQGFNVLEMDEIGQEVMLDNLSAIIPDISRLSNQAKKSLIQGDIISIWFKYGINLQSYTQDEIEIIKTIQENIDSIKRELEVRHQAESKEDCYMKLYVKVYDKAKGFIFSGQNVVIDTVVYYDLYLQMLNYCFNYYPIELRILYSSLNENLTKCLQRDLLAFKNDNLSENRDLGLIIKQYNKFYKFIPSDSSMKDKVFAIEEISVPLIKEILKSAQVCEKFLLKNSKIYNNPPEEGFLRSSITDLIAALTHTNSTKVFVVPKVKFEFLMRNSKELLDFNLLAKKIDPKKECSGVIEELLELFNESKSDDQFLIYHKDSSPPLIGEPFIMEQQFEI